MKDFAAVATQYAQDVVDGKIAACKWQKHACRRHLADLERAKGGWKYQFNPELTDREGKQYFPAQRICRFAEMMPHVKGDWAADNQLIVLKDWQIFVLASIFGWVNSLTGKRRFRIADLFVPRKNGKSIIAAVIGLYMFAADGEYGAEVYSGATNLKQAMEVFGPARLMTEKSVAFRAHYGVIPQKKNLAILDTNSKFEPVIGKPGDGASPSCWIVDEYHEHDTDEMYETGKTGMIARSQPLLLVITTAGDNIGGPCFEHQKQLQNILEGTIENDERFGIIFGIDNEKEWSSEDGLRKANPNFGVSVNAEALLRDLRDALADPRKQSTFKTKHLNVWVASASPWINLENLQACGDPTLKIEDFLNDPCWAGLDLASKQDIASRVLEFTRTINGKKHYYAFSRNYVPAAMVEKPEKENYRGWVEQGHLVKTDGSMIDLELIQEELLADTESLQLEEVTKDPWGGQQLGANIEAQGIVVVDIPQRVSHLSEPMKDIAALIDAGQFHHDGNPVFVWAMSNVEVKPDRNENIFPRRPGLDRKIDPAAALINAHSRAMLGEVEEDNLDDFLNDPIIVS